MSTEPEASSRMDKVEAVLLRIAEKHEGLSHSVELLVAMHNEHELQFQEHRIEFQEHRSEFQANQKVLTNILVDIRDAVTRLSIIAEAHQETLDHHDSRLGRLEKDNPPPS